MRFTGRTVLVTGGASGIGFQIASKFLAEGATVYAADLNPEACPEGTRKLLVDVTEEAMIRDAIGTLIAETGRLDVLCNNAGLGSTTDPVSCTSEEWDRVFAVNARGVFLGTKYALPHMLERSYGVLIHTASAAGLAGLKDRSAYGASKGAVIAFSKHVAVQYAGTGIRSNTICPGTVDSPWVERLLEGSADRAGARQQLVGRQPMGRLGKPVEIAMAAAYLASDEAEFITGTDLVIDGGFLAG